MFAKPLNFIRSIARQYFGTLLICATVLGAIPNSGLANDSEHFATAQEAIAILHTATGTGSGFVAQMGDHYYLITNEHVLRGGRPFRALLIDGTMLSYDYVEVAADRDLVRLRLTNPPPVSLSLANRRISIGDRIFVYGNSDGSGVITSIAGRIQGVGPDLVEVDAAFVRGNSGSPVLNTHGEVVAIATYVERYPDPDDWVKEGTRFSEIRRFGVRPNVSTWTQMTLDDYFVRAGALQALRAFTFDLHSVMYMDHYFDARAGLYRYNVREHTERYGHQFIGMSELVCDLVQAYNEMLRHAHSTISHADRARASRSRSEFEQHRRRTSIEYMQFQTRSQAAEPVYRRIRQRVLPFIRNHDWKSPWFTEEARFWHQVLVTLLDSAH